MDPCRLPVTIDIGPGATKRLAAFCATHAKGRLRLVADRNTWKAAGEETEAEIRAVGLEIRSTIFEEDGLAADARNVFRLLVDDNPGEKLYIAVGSGTITDIVRFVCHRTGREFVSMATAPSVDAYSSVVAPVIVDGAKRTLPAEAPIAVFADPGVLARAPRPMIAAGFGDMVCKFTAVADWRLGALIWEEPFNEAIAKRSVAAARACVDAVEAIGTASADGLAALMGALVESGLCMALAGHSRPASGAEHQYSHFWEMRLLAEGRPPVLHGLKVGIGSLEAAGLWDGLRGMTREAAASALARSRLPPRSEEEGFIRGAYGAGAEEAIASQERFLAMGEIEYGLLKDRILENWDAILGFAATVPDAKETGRLLALAGCPTDPRELGLGEDEIALAYKCAHYTRNRFTIKKLSRMLRQD